MSESPVLRLVSQGKPVSRDHVKSLWQQGLVTGMFNIPNEEVFGVCVDFCILSTTVADPKEVTRLQEELASLNASKVEMEEELLKREKKFTAESTRFKKELRQLRQSQTAEAVRAHAATAVEESLRSEVEELRAAIARLEAARVQEQTAEVRLEVLAEECRALRAENEKLTETLESKADLVRDLVAQLRHVGIRYNGIRHKPVVQAQGPEESGRELSQNDLVNGHLLRSALGNFTQLNFSERQFVDRLFAQQEEEDESSEEWH